MMIKNPISLSLISLVITFVITSIIYYFTKPKFILTDPTDKTKIAWDKFVAYAVLVSLIIAIVVLIISNLTMKRRKSSVSSSSSGFSFCR